MKAVKENKEYSITEENKAAYLAQGYNITDDKGNIVERSPKDTVPYSEYEKLKKKYEELLEKVKEQPADELEKLNVDELKEYAQNHNIDTGRASTKEGILEKIREALKEKEA